MGNVVYKNKPTRRLLKESDTRAKLVDPRLYQSGWTEDLIEREYTIAEGRIEIIGDETKRQKPRWVDYILRASPGATPIAVLEAEPESQPALSGMQQAKAYAERMDVHFAYSTNGHEIEEYDFVNHKHRKLKKFPSPKELVERYVGIRKKKLKIAGEVLQKTLNTPFYTDPTGFKLRYYQEAAVEKSIEALLAGRNRILLTLATGSGKTWIAFNMAWRLKQAGKIRRVLFLADRNFLRNQAYNQAFAPFGDARVFIPDSQGRITRTRDIYFSIYQAMYAQTSGGKRTYQEYPPDFFDLIIIDECHRSGFGTWHDILKHFKKAIHLGMTATPKRDDNIDTYQYFGEPVYTYTFGAGVEDGYLSPFLVHRVLTNIDKKGKLSLKEARTQGAEVIYSPETEVKDIYEQQEFEKTITLPDRTKTIAKHIAKTLRLFDPMGKTMVFCVNMDHAEEVAALLQNEFSDLGYDNFAVPIISRTGDIKADIYERFKDSDKRTPVIATTVDLLTTGVDVPSVKNIVIIKPIASKIVFKQIIGRGSRIDPLVDKYFFRIIDYVGATRLFDDWESPPEPLPPEEPGVEDKFLSGVVVDVDTQEPIRNALVTLQLRPNRQDYKKTDKEGRFSFEKLPDKKMKAFVFATGYKKRQISTVPFDSPDEFILIELKPERKAPKAKVKIKDLPVHIEEEDTVVLETDGRTLKVTEYVNYTKEALKKRVAKKEDLLKIWLNKERRNQFLRGLQEKSIYPELLGRILNHPNVDPVDLLASVAFGSIPLTRDERVRAFENVQHQFLSSFPQDAREVVFALLEKYRAAGIDEVVDPRVFEIPPFDKMGYVDGVIKRFRSVDKLRDAISEVEERIYQSI